MVAGVTVMLRRVRRSCFAVCDSLALIGTKQASLPSPLPLPPSCPSPFPAIKQYSDDPHELISQPLRSLISDPAFQFCSRAR
jgi:hypothetical protein